MYISLSLFFILLQVAVNVAGNSTVDFELVYHELLERRNGLFEHRISIRPNQVVRDLQVEVIINDPQGIREVNVMEPFGGTNTILAQDTVISSLGEAGKMKKILYAPSVERQQEMDQQKGLSGDFVVYYDVNHAENGGLIQVEDTYFVHFFSPSSLLPLNKNVIFVIDISGSMGGEKIEQTREAMLEILGQMRQEDTFMLLLFDDSTEYWPASKTLVSAHADNIYAAKTFVRHNVVADGGTNLDTALVEGCERLQTLEQYGSGIVVFLTDGHPTVGETRTSSILSNVEDACKGKVTIFSLGFGFDLDYDLLRAVSFSTGGFARRIYMGVDAPTQLQNFFSEIGTPVMYDVKMVYSDNIIDMNSLTQNSFPQYFNGSELVVSGKLRADAPAVWECTVTGEGATVSQLLTEVTVPEESSLAFEAGFLEKLYVYMKIQDLLKQELVARDEAEKETIKAYALQLALDYKLVTPLTSFIIVQQNQGQEEWGHDMDSVLMAAAPPPGVNVKAAAYPGFSMNGVSVATSTSVISVLSVILSGVLCLMASMLCHV